MFMQGTNLLNYRINLGFYLIYYLFNSGCFNNIHYVVVALFLVTTSYYCELVYVRQRLAPVICSRRYCTRHRVAWLSLFGLAEALLARSLASRSS